METDERLQRIETDIHEMKASMTAIQVSLADMKATMDATLPHLATKDSVARIEDSLPHLATKAEVEEAKHEATKGKNSLLLSVLALLVALGTFVTRFVGQ